MLEHELLADLSPAQLRRRLLSVEAQLRRGVPERRVPGLVAHLGDIRAALGLPPLEQALQLAQARALLRDDPAVDSPDVAELRAALAPKLLEERELPSDVAGLCTRRRQLHTTSRTPEREARIAARIREIDRLLGASPSDYAALRVAAQRCEDACWELELGSLEWVERQQVMRRAQSAFRRGIIITNRMCTLGGDAARACALEAYRKLTRAAGKRILQIAEQSQRELAQSPVGGRPRTLSALIAREYTKWFDVYRELELDWPVEPS